MKAIIIMNKYGDFVKTVTSYVSSSEIDKHILI